MEDKQPTMSEWFNSVYDDDKPRETKWTSYVKELTTKSDSRLDVVADIIAARLRRNYDFVCAITGFEGTGKSVLEIQLGMAVSKRLHVPFDLDKNLVYRQEGTNQYDMIRNKLLRLPKYSTCGVDEAAEGMYSRDWNKKEQKDNNKLFMEIRKRNLFVPLCIPNLQSLDSFFKNIRVLAWFHIFARGKAGLFIKDNNPFNPDPFNFKESKKIIEDQLRKERYDVDEMIHALHENIPNFVIWFNIPPLNPKIEAEYLKHADTYAFEMPKEEKSLKEQMEEMRKEEIALLFESSPKWNVPTLAKRFSTTEYKIRKILEEARKKSQEVAPNGQT